MEGEKANVGLCGSGEEYDRKMEGTKQSSYAALAQRIPEFCLKSIFRS